MSLFGSSMMNLLVGSAVSKGASLAGDYFKENIYSGSFLETTYKEYIDPYNPFGTADEVRDASGKVVQKAVASGASQLLAQGLGVDPSSGRNMPNINVPEGDTFRSRNTNFSKGNYGGYPQGTSKILENAFRDPAIRQFAFDYKQSRMPNINVVSPTVSMGSSKIGGLDKGYIRSVKS